MKTTAIVVLTLSMAALAIPLSATEQALELGVDREAFPVPVEGIEDMEGKLYRDGRVFIGAQPSEETLKELAELGVEVVVSMRTPSEMEDRERVSFDEPAAVVELGMDFDTIPLGGDDHPYSPEVVDRLERVLETSTGPVFLHCTGGGRSAYVWIAYLVARHDFGLDEAMARGEAMMLKQHPVGRLLGQPTELRFASIAPAEEADPRPVPTQ